MQNFLPPFILAFREALEAFLLIAILLDFLGKTNSQHLKKSVWAGLGAGTLISMLCGGALIAFAAYLGDTEELSELWENLASLGALALITTFIVWMIKEGGNIKRHTEAKAASDLSSKGIFLLAMFMLGREGVEIAFFAFAGKYALLPLGVGVLAAGLFVLLIHFSLVRIPLKHLFTITLLYLIVQAGFLLGHSSEEAFSILGLGEKADLFAQIIQYAYIALFFIFAAKKPPCVCMRPPFHYSDFQSVALGVDSTDGRFGDVSFEQCKHCQSIWLRYFMEIEAYEKSGRWYRGLIESEQRAGINPTNALSHLENLKWYFYGGSYFGTSGKKGSGKIIL